MAETIRLLVGDRMVGELGDLVWGLVSGGVGVWDKRLGGVQLGEQVRLSIREKRPVQGWTPSVSVNDGQ